MTLYQILSFVFKRLTTIVVTFVIVVGTTTFLVYAIAPVYEANSRILIERNRLPTNRTDFAPGLEMLEVLNSEAALATSRSVIVAVVDLLKPHERPSGDSALRRFVEAARVFLDEAGLVKALLPRDRWIARLERQLEARPVPNSNVLEITFASEDPELAAAITNAVAEAYFDHRWAVYRSSGESDFYLAKLEEVTSRLDDRRRRLDAIRDELGLNELGQERDLLIRRSGELAAQMAVAQGEYEAVLERYREGHPRVTAADGRVAALRAEIAAVEQRLKGLEEQTAEVDQLGMMIAADEATFRRYKEQLDQSLLSEVGTSYLANARLVDPAMIPKSPKFSRLFIILLSVPVGLLAAFSIAFIREYFDNSIAREPEAEQAAGVPCFGSIPRIGFLRRLAA